MTCRLFEGKEQSAMYQKYMLREPEELQRLIKSYLEEKANPFGLAVDVGCGTGQSTRVLVPLFQKVVGIDISKSQIEEAKMAGSFPNLSYIVAPAENLPFDDSSVDLITASLAVHWFNVEEFFKEADRVLKPNGCLALYCLHLHFDLQYKECSKDLTDVFMEALNFLWYEYGTDKLRLVTSEYKEIFDAVPFADKKRFTGVLLKLHMSFASFMCFFKSLYVYQIFLSRDPETAKEFLQELQERLLKIMGVSSTDTEIEINNRYCCVLACKTD